MNASDQQHGGPAAAGAGIPSRSPPAGIVCAARSSHLPAPALADLPEPIPLRRMLGPSVILLASSIGSGEFILWPNITARFGFVFFWAAMAGIVTQYFLNLEIERWTLATGETAVTGFCRMSRWWAPAFIVMTIVPWAWPGWATGATTCITFLTGQQEEVWFGVPAHAVYAIGVLFIVGVLLTLSPVVYSTVEKVQMVLIALVLVFLVVAVVQVTTGESWLAMLAGIANVGSFPPIATRPGAEGMQMAAMLGAIAYAGAGGALNLAQANWIRDKGYAMGARIPRIVSPFTGKEEARVGTTGFQFPPTPENLERWRQWWHRAVREHFWTFLVLGALAIMIMSVLAHSTVYGRGDLGSDLDFVYRQGLVLKEQVGPWFGACFWLMGAAVLFTTELGIIDMVGRVVADILKVNVFPGASESRLYFVVVWAELLFGSAIILAGWQKPFQLIVIGAALNGLVMFVYSILLLWMNSRRLHPAVAIGPMRFFVMVWCCGFFGYFSLSLLRDAITKLAAG